MKSDFWNIFNQKFFDIKPKQNQTNRPHMLACVVASLQSLDTAGIVGCAIHSLVSADLESFSRGTESRTFPHLPLFLVWSWPHRHRLRSPSLWQLGSTEAKWGACPLPANRQVCTKVWPHGLTWHRHPHLCLSPLNVCHRDVVYTHT